MSAFTTKELMNMYKRHNAKKISLKGDEELEPQIIEQDVFSAIPVLESVVNPYNMFEE